MSKHSSIEVDGHPSQELIERRYVYNGDEQRSTTEFAPRGNRPVQRRKRSPFLIIGGLIVVSFLIVLYVWNKITVNRLAFEVSELQTQFEKVQNANDILRAEINKLSNIERIGKIATSQLHLVSPKEQPVWFDVDAERLEHIQQ